MQTRGKANRRPISPALATTQPSQSKRRRREGVAAPNSTPADMPSSPQVPSLSPQQPAGCTAPTTFYTGVTIPAVNTIQQPSLASSQLISKNPEMDQLRET